jgi:hypothetical protein
MSARFSPRRRDVKVRPCAYCGGEAAQTFCQACYSLVDGLTKSSMRNLFTLGSPRLAIRRVVDALDALHAAGVPVPAKKTRSEESEVEV